MKKHSRSIWGIVLHETQTNTERLATVEEAIDKDHKSRGWEAIGYHYLINPKTGAWIRTRRPVNMRGAHVKGKNDGLIGIGILGWWSYKDLPLECAVALGDFISSEFCWALSSYGLLVSPDWRFYTHSELLPGYTDCGTGGPMGDLVSALNRVFKRE